MQLELERIEMREEEIVCQIINIRQEKIVDENGITHTAHTMCKEE